MIAGFLLSAYSIVANDALQTLGTFLSANEDKPWWLLWSYAGFILTTIFIAGWFFNGGDPAYGRLTIIPVPYVFTPLYLVPPIAILILTNFGIPVSTTFLVLTIFAPQALDDMVIKSLFGYGLAFSVSLIVYRLIIAKVEGWFIADKDKEISPLWVVLQWVSTGFLWSQWLIQDFANIFAYLPRQLSLQWLLFALGVMLLLHAIIFINRGGEIGKIITSKTNTQDIRSATFINVIYGSILLFFAQYSQVPMSTTWVFLGLLAGREISISWNGQGQTMRETLTLIGKDGAKALLGLVISVILAYGLPWLIGQNL
ncbi:MAG: hypothetical protein N5P05_003367 [Chroococcopsis gigantea SAG 12.99]|nr:hypothetical protein [Chlorogloea purpurea SAG 13.99]MDV3001761.1 hypothetical protein [Chroococcopsis gigantea SAG 12.99]